MTCATAERRHLREMRYRAESGARRTVCLVRARNLRAAARLSGGTRDITLIILLELNESITEVAAGNAAYYYGAFYSRRRACSKKREAYNRHHAGEREIIELYIFHPERSWRRRISAPEKAVRSGERRAWPARTVSIARGAASSGGSSRRCLAAA